MQNLRGSLEDEVEAAHGTIGARAAGLIQTACRHETAARLFFKWLKDGGEGLGVAARLAFTRGAMRATALRDLALERLGLGLDTVASAVAAHEAAPGAAPEADPEAFPWLGSEAEPGPGDVAAGQPGADEAGSGPPADPWGEPVAGPAGVYDGVSGPIPAAPAALVVGGNGEGLGRVP